MSSESLAVYDEQLAYLLGESGQHTELAVYDPSGEDPQEIYGIFSEHTVRGEKDSGNVKQKKMQSCFVVKTVPTFDIYADKTITIRERNYTIEYIDKDVKGAQVIWLY